MPPTAEAAGIGHAGPMLLAELITKISGTDVSRSKR
jgi:hypothetical protein